MKVNIYETVEISDEQRVQMAVVLDDGQTKPKRKATRDEMKGYIWEFGRGWELALSAATDRLLEGSDEPDEPLPADDEDDDDEDLLGDVTADDIDEDDLI